MNNKDATKANILEGLKSLADQYSQATIFSILGLVGVDKTDNSYWPTVKLS